MEQQPIAAAGAAIYMCLSVLCVHFIGDAGEMMYTHCLCWCARAKLETLLSCMHVFNQMRRVCAAVQSYHDLCLLM